MKKASLRRIIAVAGVCNKCSPDKALTVHAQDMTQVAQSSAAYCKVDVVGWLSSSYSEGLASYGMQAPTVEPVGYLLDARSEGPCLSCMGECGADCKAVQSQFHGARQSNVLPHMP